MKNEEMGKPVVEELGNSFEMKETGGRIGCSANI